MLRTEDSTNGQHILPNGLCKLHTEIKLIVTHRSIIVFIDGVDIRGTDGRDTLFNIAPEIRYVEAHRQRFEHAPSYTQKELVQSTFTTILRIHRRFRIQPRGGGCIFIANIRQRHHTEADTHILDQT